MRALLAIATLLAASSCGDETTTPEAAPMPSADPARTPPVIDTSTMEPLVREMLESRRAAVVARPNDGKAWADLGFALDAHFFLEEAEDTLAVAVELDPTGFEAAYDYAVVGTFLPRDADEITARFEAAIALRTDYAPGPARLGNHLLTNGDAETAEAAFRSALDVYAEYDYAKLGLGRALLDQDDVAGALAQLEPLFERYPGDPALATALGQAYTFDGRVADAAKVTERHAAADPAKVNLMDTLRKEIMSISRSAAMNYQRGEVKARRGDFAGAAIEFERVLSVDPDNRKAQLMLVAQLIQLRRLDEARERLNAALENDPNDADAHRLLGQLDVEATDHESGCHHFEIAARAGALDATSYLAWTTALAQLREWDETLYRVDEWAAAYPDHPDPPYLRALALYRAGRKDEAKKQLEAAIAAHPTNPKRVALERMML